MELYHGTFCAIHKTDRRFLDPKFAKRNGDDGDPETNHVFATPNKSEARQFALRTPKLTTNLMTSEGPVAVYIGSPPAKDAKGYVYELPSEGFNETLRRDKPSGMWAMLEGDMPLVLDADGNEVPGIPLGPPVEVVTMLGLIEEDT